MQGFAAARGRHDDKHRLALLHQGDRVSAPTGDALSDEVYDACHDAFKSYVGIDYESSSYKVTAFYPTTSTWVQGDRTINCLITSKDGQLLTGSARNTKK